MNTSLRPKALALGALAVAVGGALGTLIRDGATSWNFVTPTHNWWTHIPWALLVINFVGVFIATKALRTVLAHHDPNHVTRLLVITGFLGGLTSYSGLYVALKTIWDLSLWGAVFVALLAVLTGLLGAALGMRRWVRS